MQFSLSGFDVLTIFFAGSAILTSLMVVILLRDTWLKRFTANRFATLLLVTVACLLVMITIDSADFTDLSPNFYYLPLDYTFSFGPLIYFYTRTMLKPERKFGGTDWLHFILPAIQGTLMFVLNLLSIRNQEWFWVNVDSVWYGEFDALYTSISMVVYGGAAGILAYQHQTATEEEATRLRWVRTFCSIFILCALFSAIVEEIIPRIIIETTNINPWNLPVFDSVPPILYSLALFLSSFGLYLYHQQEFEYAKEREALAAAAATQTLPNKSRKETYGIGADQLAIHKEKLAAYMLAEKPYLDSRLTMARLGKQVDIPARHISYVVNESFGKSFNDFVNQFRVEEACKMLGDPSFNYRSVLEIGIESGFSSKSTFNRVFKQLTGQTPSQYRESEREQRRLKSS